MEHILSSTIGVILAFVGFFVLKMILNRWQTDSILVNPKTGTSFEIKQRKGKYRYYVNMFRVSEKTYDWFWNRNAKKMAEEMKSKCSKKLKGREYFDKN